MNGDIAANLRALSQMRAADWQRAAAELRENVPRLQLEVIQMHLRPGRPPGADEIAHRCGIESDEAARIVKAFREFVSKKVF